jgi:thiopeptide-type bacteriocin biosynthesis protein
VVHGRLVLARARWLLLAKDIEGLIEAKDSVGRAGALAGLRARHRLPAWVVVTSADHQLPIWLDGDAGVDLLVHEGRQSGSLTLTELLPEPDRLVVQRPEGRVNHEVVVPFVAPPTSPVSGRSVATVAGDPAPRTFAPGSVWVSAKLYTGKATADAGLRDAVAPLVDALRADGAIDGWFFLRYGDPDWHLRVRLHASASDRAPEVAAAVGGATQAMLDDGRISRIVLDTYNREVERYGGSDGVALSERVFEADSDAALAIVEAAGGEDGLDARWRLALVGVDRLLTDFGMGLDERRPLVRSWATALEAEHGRGGLEARRWAGRLFRSERGPLQRLLTGDGSGLVPEITAGFDALARRSGALAPVVADLRAAADRGRLTTSLVALANSYCHMHVNRVLRASQRVQELVIYDLLDRAYQAQRARGRA